MAHGLNVGEFGWELFCWQNFARTIAKDYDIVRVICRTRSVDLYSDFADYIYISDPEPGFSDMWMHSSCTAMNPWRIIYDYEKFIKTYATDPSKVEIMRPQLINYNGEPMDIGMDLEDVPNRRFWKQVEPSYQSYREKEPASEPTVTFHARQRLVRAGDNWAPGNWNKLAELCLNEGIMVYFIGSVEESIIPGINSNKIIDARGYSLYDTIKILNASHLFASPSSGPVHLAALCDTPHIVWTIPANKERNTKLWNPFDTDVTFVDEYEWQPPPEYIFELIKDKISNA